MGRCVCAVLILFGMSVAWVACSIDHTVAPSSPAAKMTTGDSSERYYIHWTCGANEWSVPADSVWTVFYGANRFYTDGQRVHISEYITPNSKRVYWAAETASKRYKRASAGLVLSDNTCAMWSDLIDRDTSVVRIYRGEVDWRYRALKNYSRYSLLEGDEWVRFADVRDSLIVHIDFDNWWVQRNLPCPMALGDARAYYPFNFSQTAIDTMLNVPGDDRPYLLDVVCAGDDCPEFLQPAAAVTRTTERRGGNDDYIDVQASKEEEEPFAEADNLSPVVIDCGSVPQEILDAREALDRAQVIHDEAQAVWNEAFSAVEENHGFEAAKGCLAALSYDPLIYPSAPPCAEHHDAYLAQKAADGLLADAENALAQLEEEHGIPLPCR